MTCNWVLKLGEYSGTFNSEFELDGQIRDLIVDGKVNLNGLLDTIDITPSLSPQMEVKNIIEGFVSEVKAAGQERIARFGDDPDDFEIYYEIKGSIGVTRFLQQTFSNDGVTPLCPPFDEKGWKDRKLDEYLAEGYSKADALRLINKEMSSWPKMSEMGTEVHKLFEWVLSGEEGTVPKRKWLSKELQDETLDQIRKFKEHLKSMYGDDCDFYTEVPIMSNDIEPAIKELMGKEGYDSINGKIDLLVVDKNGVGHIFDFKVSRKVVNGDVWDQITRMSNKAQREMEKDKPIGQHWWSSAKKESASFQLSMYSAMLRQKGIDVRDANIVPIHTTLTYKDSDQLEVDGITGVDVQFEGNEMITNIAGLRGNGRYGSKVSNVFHNSFNLTGELSTNLQNIQNAFFPKNTTITDREHNKANIDHYKNDPKTVSLVKPSDDKHYGTYKYKIIQRALDHKVEYAVDDADLEEKLKTYVEKISNAKAEDNIDLANRIDSLFNNQSTKDDFCANLPIHSRNFLKMQFERYYDNHWFFERDDALNGLGIFVFTKGNLVEIVSLTDQSLKNEINLGKDKHDVRKNILGKTKKDRVINKREVLSSTGGHMELMKAMAYVALKADSFANKKIAEIRVINPYHGEEDATIPNSQLIKNYNALCRENPEAGAPKVWSDLFMNDVDAYVHGARERWIGNTQDFDGFFDANKTVYTAEWCKSAIEKMRTDKTYGEILYNENDYNPNDPVWHAYTYLNRAYLATQGYYATTEKDIEYYTTGGIRLDGLNITSMQFSQSSNIRTLGEIINKFSVDLRKKVHDDGHKMRSIFDRIYDEYGNNPSIFKSWLRTDNDGNIRGDLILRDPEDPEIANNPLMKEGLDCFLKTMAKLRWGDISDADLEFYKENEAYYELPLTEATAKKQFRAFGLKKTVQNKIAQVTELTEGIFAGSDIDVEEFARRNNELYNKFDLTGTVRDQFIESKGGAGFFEYDMETIFNQALVAYSRSSLSKEYLPLIGALKLSLTHAERFGSDKRKDETDKSNILTTFDKLIKSKVYGESVASKNEQKWIKVINLLKAGFTTMTLSLNNRSMLRESLQGIWTGNARALAKLLPGVDEKHYVKALTHVMQEAHKNISGVSKLQQLNQIMGMANQSWSQIARNRRLNWANIYHWSSDTLFLTATAPDFLHRVSILVAKMMSDGCWEAYELDENEKLIYNFDKDERFKIYTSKDTSNSEYAKQKALYLKLLDEFNKEGYRKEDGSMLKEGDPLPQAYTAKENQSIKNYADLLYGHYDDESRSLICDGLIGSLFLQYKTFLTAKLEQWMMTGGVYSTETIVQQKDADGRNLYELIRYDHTDENGNPIGMPHRDILTEDEYNALSEEEKVNARLYFDYEGIPMEGMLGEQLQFVKSLVTLDTKGFSELWHDPIRRGYFLLGCHDMWLMVLMGILVNFIFGNIYDIEKKDKQLYATTVRRQIRDVDPTGQLLYNVLTGSFLDTQLPQILGQFTDRPPVITAATKFGQSTLKLFEGESSLPYWTTQNWGMFRDFQGITKRALEK